MTNEQREKMAVAIAKEIVSRVEADHGDWPGMAIAGERPGMFVVRDRTTDEPFNVVVTPRRVDAVEDLLPQEIPTRRWAI
jgi:hypothetical protein